MTHTLRWHTGSPLWPLALADGGTSPVRFSRPVILRFAGDDFMQRLQGTLSSAPARLSEFAVRQETWQTPPDKQVGWLPLSDENNEPPPKLYQPAHNRFYLIAGQLVCQQRGLPDRTIDAAAEEQASFVIRKLAGSDEYGWFGNRQAGRWRRLADPDGSAPDGEERLAMFPFTFKDGDRRRRLMAGLIPAASRELYEGGNPKGPLTLVSSEVATDPRMARFSAEVAAELRSLGATTSPGAEDTKDRLVSLLITLSDYIADVLSDVFEALTDNRNAERGVARNILHILETNLFGSVSWVDLLRAAARPDLRARYFNGEDIAHGLSLDDVRAEAIVVAARRLYESELAKAIAAALMDPRLDEVTRLFDTRIIPLRGTSSLTPEALLDQMLSALAELADFLSRETPALWDALQKRASTGLAEADLAAFKLLNQEFVGPLSVAAALVDAERHGADIAAGDTRRTSLQKKAVTSSQIQAAAARITDGRAIEGLAGIFADNPLKPGEPPAPAAEAIYVIRCVLDRPECEPFAGPVVGRRSRPFRLAAYFDPDAPVRPLKIRMPLDTTPEGLAKFPKGVSVILSDELRKQMARAEQAGMQGLIDGPPDVPPFNLGVICSMSIPIITICALILLMVVVNLLNIIFRWLPFFRICLPVPVKAK